MRFAANDPVDSLIASSLEAYERGDADGLAFAILRAGQLGANDTGVSLITHLLRLDHVPAHLGRRAFHLLKQEASESANPMVHYTIALVLLEGAWSIEMDVQGAFNHLLRAEELGYLDVALLLGVLCTREFRSSDRHRDAKEWFRRAAKQGFLFAEAQLVRMDETLGFLNRTWRLFEISTRSFRLAMSDPTDKRLFYLNPRSRFFHAPMG